jgi:hypothetical protein
MEFIETSIFTRQVIELLDDESYLALQIELLSRPDAGSVIRGSGGLRKLRWAGRSHGKRGGVRIIYYWITADDQIYLLFMYPKNVRDDLSPAQLKALRELVEE